MRKHNHRHVRKALSCFLEAGNMDSIASLQSTLPALQFSHCPRQYYKREKCDGKTCQHLFPIWKCTVISPSCAFLNWLLTILLHTFANSLWVFSFYTLPSEYCSLQTSNCSSLLNTAHRCSCCEINLVVKYWCLVGCST